jgi:hypothetical protein
MAALAQQKTGELLARPAQRPHRIETGRIRSRIASRTSAFKGLCVEKVKSYVEKR